MTQQTFNDNDSGLLVQGVVNSNAKGGVILLRDTVSNGDKYSVYVRNDTDTDNVIVQTMNLDIER